MSGKQPDQVKPDRFALSSLIDALPDAIIMADEDGQIVKANTQAIGMFGYAREELIGAKVEILLPGSFHKAHIAQRRQYVQKPRVRPMGSGAPLSARHKDGHEFQVEIRLAPYQAPDGFLVVASIREVAQRD
ncbi:PAS domain S-box protein [Gemmatimonadota bacterium]